VDRHHVRVVPQVAPEFVEVHQAEGRDEVEEHPRREELPHRRRSQARAVRDVLDDAGELLRGELADLRLTGRGVGLQLDKQQVLVGDERRVAPAHRLERLGALEALARLLERPDDRRATECHRLEEKLALRPEEPEKVGLRDPRRGSDLFGRRPVDPVPGENPQRGLQHGAPPLVGGHAQTAAFAVRRFGTWRGYHHPALVITHNYVNIAGPPPPPCGTGPQRAASTASAPLTESPGPGSIPR
jgi:hypothetical protein